jgi:hypothetical protein
MFVENTAIYNTLFRQLEYLFRLNEQAATAETARKDELDNMCKGCIGDGSSEQQFYRCLARSRRGKVSRGK